MRKHLRKALRIAFHKFYLCNEDNYEKFNYDYPQHYTKRVTKQYVKVICALPKLINNVFAVESYYEQGYTVIFHRGEI